MGEYRKKKKKDIKKTIYGSAFLFSYKKIVYDEAVWKRSRE